MQVAAQDEAVAREVHAAPRRPRRWPGRPMSNRVRSMSTPRGALSTRSRGVTRPTGSAARIAKIDTADRHLTEVNGELGQIRLSERSMRLIEAAAAAVDVASAGGRGGVRPHRGSWRPHRLR